MIAVFADGSFGVTCLGDCTRLMSKVVKTRTHAENLERWHWGKYHPGEIAPCDVVPEQTGDNLPPLLLDLGAAAAAYLRHPHRFSAAVFAALLGVDERDTAKLTELATLARDSRALAHVPPF